MATRGVGFRELTKEQSKRLVLFEVMLLIILALAASSILNGVDHNRFIGGDTELNIDNTDLSMLTEITTDGINSFVDLLVAIGNYMITVGIAIVELLFIRHKLSNTTYTNIREYKNNIIVSSGCLTVFTIAITVYTHGKAIIATTIYVITIALLTWAIYLRKIKARAKEIELKNNNSISIMTEEIHDNNKE